MYASLFVAGCVTLLALVVTRVLSGPSRKLPPGPSGLPIIGSVHHLPATFIEYTFWDWRKQFGDVIFLRLFSRPTLVLNSLTAARDLLDKRSAKYSDRPRMVLMNELIGYSNSVPTMAYGERFRRQRKWIHDAMGTRGALASYEPSMRRGAHALLRDLLDTPDAFSEHLYKYVASLIVEVAYGRRATSMRDELVVAAESALEATNDTGSAGALVVDFFPVLKMLPAWMIGAGFQRKASHAHRQLMAWQARGLEMVREDMAAGTGAPCVTSRLLEEHKDEFTEEVLDDIRGTGVAIYGAGTETTHGTLGLFFLTMVRNPHVFKKAQEEMDAVVGRERLPDVADRAALPYLGAILEELYRWRPGISLALPHRLTSDDKYRDFDIPAGCMVMPNIWGMSRDEAYYPEPDEFRPERHLGATSPGSEKEAGAGGEAPYELPSNFVFGFGRRSCPGQAFADRVIWLAAALIVATFDIKRTVDASGREVVPPAAFKPGMTTRAEPFQCKIMPRSDKHAQMILQLDH